MSSYRRSLPSANGTREAIRSSVVYRCLRLLSLSLALGMLVCLGQTLSSTHVGGVTPALGASCPAESSVQSPCVASVTPSTGAPGIQVEITGTGFDATAQAFFGDVGATISFETSTLLDAIVPAGSGTVDVTVDTATMTGLVNSPGDQFTYTQPPPVPEPSVTITPSSTITVTGQTVTFSISATPTANATITRITLNCGNGTPVQTVQNGTASCTYTAPGTFTVMASATDSSGAPAGQATATVSVFPQSAPQTSACPLGNSVESTGQQTVSNTACPNANGPYKTFGTQPITFSAAGSQVAPGYNIVLYLWNFGDGPQGTFVGSLSPAITHSYKASYTYDVTLVVISGPATGAQGGAALDIQTATANTIAAVYPPLPNCYPPTGAGPFGPGQCASVLVSCSASLTQACALPPGCGVGQVVGTCSVPSSCMGPIAGSACVTPCPPDALSPPILATVCPQVPPTAASPVTVSAGGPYQGVAGAPILFSATATGSVASNVCTDGSNYGLPGLACTTLVSPASAGSYLWQFGDGTSATGQAVSHTYAAAGTYNVSVTLSLGSPGLFTAQTTVTVAGSG